MNENSMHLAILARGGLIQAGRESRQAFDAAEPAGIRQLVACLVEPCCGGRPGACAPFLEATLPHLPYGVEP